MCHRVTIWHNDKIPDLRVKPITFLFYTVALKVCTPFRHSGRIVQGGCWDFMGFGESSLCQYCANDVFINRSISFNNEQIPSYLVSSYHMTQRSSWSRNTVGVSISVPSIAPEVIKWSGNPADPKSRLTPVPLIEAFLSKQIQNGMCYICLISIDSDLIY